MLDVVRYLLDWPRNSKGDPIFRNTHDASYYATMLQNAKDLVEEIEVLKSICVKDLYLEMSKSDFNYDAAINLAAKHKFYRESIETARKLFGEEVE